MTSASAKGSGVPGCREGEPGVCVSGDTGRPSPQPQRPRPPLWGQSPPHTSPEGGVPGSWIPKEGRLGFPLRDSGACCGESPFLVGKPAWGGVGSRGDRASPRPPSSAPGSPEPARWELMVAGGGGGGGGSRLRVSWLLCPEGMRGLCPVSSGFG